VLRTMITDTPFEQKWVLQGRLCGVWAMDLQEKWLSTRSMREGRKCAVDLEDVIFVDGKGECVLLQMASEGAVLRASRAYMKHVLESLKEQQRQIWKETQECQSKPNLEHQSQPCKTL
jgi:anti-anti-sigma regulatory factor